MAEMVGEPEQSPLEGHEAADAPPHGGLRRSRRGDGRSETEGHESQHGAPPLRTPATGGHSSPTRRGDRLCPAARPFLRRRRSRRSRPPTAVANQLKRSVSGTMGPVTSSPPTRSRPTMGSTAIATGATMPATHVRRSAGRRYAMAPTSRVIANPEAAANPGRKLRVARTPGATVSAMVSARVRCTGKNRGTRAPTIRVLLGRVAADDRVRGKRALDLGPDRDPAAHANPVAEESAVPGRAGGAADRDGMRSAFPGGGLRLLFRGRRRREPEPQAGEVDTVEHVASLDRSGVLSS